MSAKEGNILRIKTILREDKFKWFYLSQFVSAEVDDIETIKYQLDHEIPKVISIIKEDDVITDKEKMLSILNDAIDIRKKDLKVLEDRRRNNGDTDKNS